MKDRYWLLNAFLGIFEMPLTKVARKRDILMDIFLKEAGGDLGFVYDALKNVSKRTEAPELCHEEILREIRALREATLNKSPRFG